MKGSHRAQSVTLVTTITTQKQPTTPAPTSTPRTSPTSSPLQQMTIPTMLAKEKEKDKPMMDPGLQIIQEALADIKALQTEAKTQSNTDKEEMKTYLQELRQEMKEMKDEIKKEIAELRTELTEVKGNVAEMDGNIKVIQQKLQDSEKRIQVTEGKIQDVGQRVEEYEDRNYAARRDFDIAITNLELHSAQHGLRFQNIEEEKDEDLPAKMAEVMGAILQLDPTDLVKEIDEVYRVQTGYVRRHNLPREVHIKFTRRIVKDTILRYTKNESFQRNGKEIAILKQVPRRVREARRQYYFLTSILIRKSIPFRWLIPEGLTLTWQSTRVKIESVEQARSFLARSGLDSTAQIRIQPELGDEVMGATGGGGEEELVVRQKQLQISQDLILDTRLREPKEPKRYYK